jgi:hypothetical protein
MAYPKKGPDLYSMARFKMGRPVMYNGEKGVIRGRYFRQATHQVLYDVEVVREGQVILLPKIAQDDLQHYEDTGSLFG